ncbi:hypothetical protein E3P92_01267 [Wallemia ichthyophaga]|uniref:Uncharacterized protein n=1 Tax=Wallemia ichthyophaga TaxID=245174 RepID=A0A4T0KSV3_WALIC|nr:hypothetical protein E3P91_00975 [Wallemia ichthyophaga]TIA92833.1 hypothetical protein E3P97_01281 [Wallemia ichthyophaga]TIA96988.1 hypothetical protein E3P95_03042 [Wallemia ichthyophaga]TIA98258.1 hypothetical protein E3P94_03000 [Wallemia ichthyophaga]TIB15062.1 hypothetical protein E3P90_01026 [Wallemia ichthyophaga]
MRIAGFRRVAFTSLRRTRSTRLYTTSKDQTKQAEEPEEPQPQPQPQQQQKKSVKQIDDEMLSKLKERDTGQEEIEEGNIGGGLKQNVRAQKFRLI